MSREAKAIDADASEYVAAGGMRLRARRASSIPADRRAGDREQVTDVGVFGPDPGACDRQLRLLQYYYPAIEVLDHFPGKGVLGKFS